MFFLTMPSITFFVRSNNDKLNSHVLYCRLTINGNKAEFSTGEKLQLKYWKQTEQIYASESVRQNEYINLLCQSLSYKLKTACIALDKDENIKPSEVINFVTKKNDKTETIYFYKIVQQFLDYEISENKLNVATLDRHKVYVSNLLKFLAGKKLAINDFTLPMAEKYKEWFKSDKKTTNNATASRNVTYFRSAMQWAIKKGIIKHHELFYYKGEKDITKEVVSLTKEELLLLIQKQFSSSVLNKVKDLYLFQVATGVSYVDIWGDFELKETEAGKIFVGTRKKTGQKYFVPYSDMAEVLLQKHNGEFPKIENQTYNRILKEVAAIVEIDKHLTTHTGRKTFATLKDEQGWSRESISIMLGHKSVKTTETHYIATTPNRLINEMVKFNKNAA